MQISSVANPLVQQLLSTVFDGVLLVDRNGRIVAANATTCGLFDITAYPPPSGQMIGQTVLEATHLRALAEVCGQATQTGLVQETSVRQVGRADRVLKVRACPVLSEKSILLILADQTEVNRLRTVRTEFVANVSHELRTPLASIRAMAETLLDGAISDTEVNERFLQTIIREADRLVSLSEDLLELSRAESGERKKSAFNLAEVLTDVRDRLLTQADRRDIKLIMGALPAIPVGADRSEMDQVFFNLLENAIKYTPREGTVRLSVQTSVGQVMVQIQDTGIGILSQDLPRIFERFWRADRARKFQSSSSGDGNNTGGTGLGLSIVKHIVEAHGGQVTAASELGEGSTFTVTLPLVTPSNP